MTSPPLLDHLPATHRGAQGVLAQYFYNLFFAPVSPGNLGFCRLLFSP